MIILWRVFPETFLSAPVSELLRETVRYISEHQRMLIGIVGGLVLLSAISTRKQNRILMVLYSAVIVYMTLLSRPAGPRRISLSLFWSYRLLPHSPYFQRQVLYNILLFVPIGMILSRLRPKWDTAAYSFYISLGIELLQFITGRGLFELDDLVSNTLGGMVGLSVGLFLDFIFKQKSGKGEQSSSDSINANNE